MAVVVDYKTWTQRNKYTGDIEYHGIARVNTAIPSLEEVEQRAKLVDQQFKDLWAKAEKRAGRKLNWVDDRVLMTELSDWYSRSLRIAFGRNESDGSLIQPLKSIDMVKAAYKLGLTPGSDPGWEAKIISLIEEGKIK